jgi:hypothetical protein
MIDLTEIAREITIDDCYQEEVEKIYEDAINNSYFLQSKNAYWTGYFMGKVNMSVSDVSLDSFYAKVLIASQKLYDKREVA